MMNQESISQFRSQLRGELIEPGDANYETARKVYNGMIDKKPRLIAKCVDVADVIAAVKFGRASGLRVSVRGGGHNAGGLGIADDALTIDLSGIKYVHVDPVAGTVRVGGGCTWATWITPRTPLAWPFPPGLFPLPASAGLRSEAD